jgi:predicted nucleic acid-binding protein
MKAHVLDANAIYRFLRNGHGADLVGQVLKSARLAKMQVFLSVINWGEVHYTLTKSVGLASAEAALKHLDNLPLFVVPADVEHARAAANLKATFGLPYADCFAAALAGRSGVLVTADTKDFRRVPWLQILELPPHKRQ